MVHFYLQLQFQIKLLGSKIRYTHFTELVHEYIPIGTKTCVDQEEDEQARTQRNGTSLKPCL